MVIGGGNLAVDVARVLSGRPGVVGGGRGSSYHVFFGISGRNAASQWEIEEGLEEGIEIFNRWGVKKF